MTSNKYPKDLQELMEYMGYKDPKDPDAQLFASEVYQIILEATWLRVASELTDNELKTFESIRKNHGEDSKEMDSFMQEKTFDMDEISQKAFDDYVKSIVDTDLDLGEDLDIKKIMQDNTTKE